MAKTAQADSRCPCGSDKPYAHCCELLHCGASAPSAEALMRSRYAAYALGLDAYIRRSWHASTRPPAQELANAEKPRWIGLQIKRHEPSDADHAIVEFSARYKINGRAFVMREISRFVREDGHWFYLDAETLSTENRT